MPPEHGLSVARSWQEAVNRLDLESLLALSDPAIEMVGPRGNARGHGALAAWLERAGLTLLERRAFAKGGMVVLEQRGTWYDPQTGEARGEADVASRLEVAVAGGRVTRVARYETLAAALEAGGLSSADEQPGEA